jgi:hypothetical protein
MADKKFAVSPVRLRPLASGVFEAESGGHAVKISLKRKPPTPSEEETEEELIRTNNPEPTVGALLRRGDEVVARRTADQITLDSGDIDNLSTWIENQKPADKLVVNVGADHITDDQIKQLAAVGSRHRLAVDVNLGVNG